MPPADIADLLSAFVATHEPMFKEALLRAHTEGLSAEAREVASFRTLLSSRWERPLMLLRVVIYIAELVAIASASNRDALSDDNAALDHALRRLHGRGVRVSKQALALLEAGHADGAMAHWRTLHELMVVACFIQEHGEECARRYLAHVVVDNYHEGMKYQEWGAKLGYKPLDAEQLAAIDDAYKSAINTYGKRFDDDYGWAHHFLPSKKGGRASFARIEESISFAHIRPLYKLACQQVHAGPKGILFSISHDPMEVVPLGPSQSGLADPGQNVGITLSQMTSILPAFSPSIDDAVAVKVQLSIADEAAAAWAETQLQMDAEDELRDADVE
jgi:hypothetical protein